MKKETKIFLKRADSFIKDSLVDLERKDFDLAMFHIEQACQLIIKAKLLDLTGYFRKTHNLRELLKDLAKIFKRSEINKFIEERWNTLRNLEFSYISSRYLAEEFRKEEVESALEIYEKLKKLLWTS